jgi:hypothetical protein
MPNPTCPQNCTVNLPPVLFSKCAPLILNSEIGRIFQAKATAAPFTDWTQAAEWVERISNSNTVGDDYIRVLTVIGDKPAGSAVVKEISNGRKRTIGKDNTLNFTIDDATQENYDWMREMECGGTYLWWWETLAGKMYGGNSGVLADLAIDDVLDRGTDAIEVLNGIITWRNKFSPERTDSPIFEGDTGGTVTPTVFDTELTFGSTSDTDAGVTGTVSTADGDQLFEFNAISPLTGTPIDMTISVGGTDEIVITTQSDYGGHAFRYTDKAGAVHTGVFTDGTVAF